jgi:adenosylhomocysteinase
MSQIDWCKTRLNKTRSAIQEFATSIKPSSAKILLCSHMEAKFIAFALMLNEAGFEVHLVSNLPTSSKKNLLDQVKSSTLTFYDNSHLSFEDSERLIHKIVNETKFDFIFDDGGHTYSKLNEMNPQCVCTEFTQSGINLAKEQTLKTTVINLNSSLTKSLVGNVYGTGISTLTAIQAITNISFHKVNVGIIGFGPVGLSCALSFKGANSNVFTYDRNESKKELAKKHGIQFAEKEELLKKCDLIITCTGRSGVINHHDMQHLKAGCILANVGHYNHEILLPKTATITSYTENIEEYKTDGKSFYLLSHGNLVNLAFGLGYPIQIIDLSFAAAVYGWMDFSKNRKSPGLYEYPKELDLKYFSDELALYQI